MKKTAIMFALALLVSSAVAQDSPKTIDRGVLNGLANTLPKPVYPDAAKAAGISGVIGVNVVIDEGGNVVSAEAELNDLTERRDADGNKLDPLPADPLLREAAEDAARKARFAPTTLSGVPVRVKGKLVYNFVGEIHLVVPPTTALGRSNGGLLNGKATSLPKPEYPAAAIAVRASGTVSVHVTIDENGTPISASALSGHPLLRKAAETAAMQARFSPTFLSEQAVRVAGVVTYNFVLPKVEDK